MRVLHALSKVSAAVGLVCLLAAPAAASFPGTNGDIAYSSQRLPPPPGSRQMIYTTGAPRSLAVGSEPAWSADGSRIAFARGDIFVMAPDGTEHKRLTNDCDYLFHEPAWSPDGTRIAYLKTADALEAIEIRDLRSGLTISSPRWSGAFTPDWSPDGSQIAYSKNGAIYTSDPAGATERQLTAPPENAYDASPSWSPDGSRVAFSSNRSGSWQIWTVAADGSEVRQLTYGSEQQSGGRPIADAPQRSQPGWSPDGTKVTFIQTGLPEQSDLYEIDLDGTNQELLTAGAFSADWQPRNDSAPHPTAFTGASPPHCVTWHRFTARLQQHDRHLSGRIRSRSSFCRQHLGIRVSVQRRLRNGRWRKIAETSANHAGDFTFTVADHSGSFRFITATYAQYAIGGRRGEACRRAISNEVSVGAG